MIQQKYEEVKIVCKICAQQVPGNAMMEHSELCRLRAELDKDIKDVDQRISDKVFDSVMKFKEVQTKYAVDKYTLL